MSERRLHTDTCDDCGRDLRVQSHGPTCPRRQVACECCGSYVQLRQTEQVDVSGEDEYYPNHIHLCPNCTGDDDQEVATDGGVTEVRRGHERGRIGSHPHVDGVTRGTMLEYDDWQWAIVTKVDDGRDPARVGFVLIDELGDAIVSILEDAWGCAEHYDAVKAYRWSDHEYWTDADYLSDDIWTTLGPVHPDTRESDGGDDEWE